MQNTGAVLDRKTKPLAHETINVTWYPRIQHPLDVKGAVPSVCSTTCITTYPAHIDGKWPRWSKRRSLSNRSKLPAYRRKCGMLARVSWLCVFLAFSGKGVGVLEYELAAQPLLTNRIRLWIAVGILLQSNINTDRFICQPAAIDDHHLHHHHKIINNIIG